LCGTRAVVEQARRFRKMWGGGMRQVGVLAAAARHALAHHRERLSDDHANAKLFAEAMARAPGAKVNMAQVETNIVNIDLDAPLTGELVANMARELGLAINASGPRRLRAVTHLDVSRADVARAAEILAVAIARCTTNGDA
jgi:threonine aldolase